MSFGNFTCSKCGKSISSTTSVCPHCGISLAGIRCSKCGHTGSSTDFIGNICPKCHAGLATASQPQVKRCPQCGQEWDYYFCNACGKTGWFYLIFTLVFALVITVGFSLGYLSHQLVFDLFKPDPYVACSTIGFGLVAAYCWYMSLGALIRRGRSRKSRKSVNRNH